MSGRQPDYRVRAMNKETDGRTEVGAAWTNEDGSIRVVINPYITLSGDDPIRADHEMPIL